MSSSKNVNNWWAQYGYINPYAKNTVVLEVRATQNVRALRVYDEIESGVYGGFMATPEHISGFSASQLQSRLALKNLPVSKAEVILQKDNTFRMGFVGENFGYQGGAIQIDLKKQNIGTFNPLGKIENK